MKKYMFILALVCSFASTHPLTKADKNQIIQLIMEFNLLTAQIPQYNGPDLESFIVEKKAAIRSQIRRGRVLLNKYPHDPVVQGFEATCNDMEHVLNYYC